MREIFGGTLPRLGDSSTLHWFSRRALAIRMRRVSILFGVAVLLLVRAPHAVFAPVLFIDCAFLLHLTNRSCLFAISPAVLRLVAHLATVVAFALEFGLATLLTIPVQPSIIDPT